MHHLRIIGSIAALVVASNAGAIPNWLMSFYRAPHPKCQKSFAKGFQPGTDSPDHSTEYCGDIGGAIYGHSKSGYFDLDVDCDGENRLSGACSNDKSGQGETSFKDEVKKKSGGKMKDLDANRIPYVVFGNEGKTPSFDPKSKGMKPLDIMAVLCGGKLVYAIWGDTNGGTTTGEGSIALAKLCFPNEKLTGDSGHGKQDVLYIGFTKGDASSDSAKWDAETPEKFSESLRSRGDALVAGLKLNTRGGGDNGGDKGGDKNVPKDDENY